MSAPAKSRTSRFWSKVDIRSENECWEWKAARVKNYGVFRAEPTIQIYAHRFSLSLKLKRQLVGKECALHTCDNPPCVNPNHLFLGDHSTNMQDMWNKNRHPFDNNQKGEKRYNTNLTECDVIEIRKKYAAGITGPKLKSEYKSNSIYDIVRGRNWKHVSGPITYRNSMKSKELSKSKFICRICKQETRVNWEDLEKMNASEKGNGVKAICCYCLHLEMVRRIAHSHNQSLRDALHNFITGTAKEEGIEEEAVYKGTK